MVLKCLFLFFACLFYGIYSVKVNLNNKTNEYFWEVEIKLFGEETPGAFSMTSGGSVELNINAKALLKSEKCLTKSYLEIFIVNELQYDDITSNSECSTDTSSDTIDKCYYFRESTLKYFILLNDIFTTYKSKSYISYLDKYRIIIINPCGIEYNIKGNIILMNPWGHLDVSDRWYPLTVFITIIFYIIFNIIWYIILYNNKSYIVYPHHMILSILLLCRLGEFISFYIDFLNYNKNGTSNSKDLLLYYLFNSTFEIIGLFFLLLISMGYKLYRPNLNIKQLRIIIFSILIYSIICYLKETCFLFKNYCHFIELFQFILRCFLLVGIVALLNALISSVQQTIRSDLWRIELYKSYLLLKSHKILRWSFYLFIILPITVYILYLSVFDWTEEWLVGVINYTIIEPGLLGYIYYHFKPSIYFTHVDGVFGQ